MVRLTRGGALILILSFSVLFPATVLAQTEKQTSPEGVQGTVEYHGQRSIKDLVPPQSLPPGYPGPLNPHPYGDAFRQYKERLYKERLQEREKGNVPIPPPPGSMAPLDPPVTVLPNNFEGLQRSDIVNGHTNGNPPDTQVAAGPDHVLEVVNYDIRIFDKSGNVISTTDLYSLFGLDIATYYIGDPRVRFDAVSGRWFISMFASQTNSAAVRLAVSITSDPTQLFNIYSFFPPFVSPAGIHSHF